MKKFIIILVCGLLIITSIKIYNDMKVVTIKSEAKIFLTGSEVEGDLNHNGRIDLQDIIMLLKKYLGIEYTEPTEPEESDDDSLKQNILTFNDVFFANSIKAAVGAENINSISEYDMLGLNYLTVEDGTEDISGINYAKNLETINLDSNITDGLNELASLPKLYNVSLGFWKDLDISFLSSLTHLRYLYYNNPDRIAGDKSAICQNKRLKELFFYSPSDTGISFLSECTYLETLELWHAFDSNEDISVLLTLPNLKSLTINTYELSEEQTSVIEQLIRNGVSYHKL